MAVDAKVRLYEGYVWCGWSEEETFMAEIFKVKIQIPQAVTGNS